MVQRHHVIHVSPSRGRQEGPGVKGGGEASLSQRTLATHHLAQLGVLFRWCMDVKVASGYPRLPRRHHSVYKALELLRLLPAHLDAVLIAPMGWIWMGTAVQVSGEHVQHRAMEIDSCMQDAI